MYLIDNYDNGGWEVPSNGGGGLSLRSPYDDTDIGGGGGGGGIISGGGGIIFNNNTGSATDSHGSVCNCLVGTPHINANDECECINPASPLDVKNNSNTPIHTVTPSSVVDNITNTIQQHPFASLALAAGLGYLLLGGK